MSNPKFYTLPEKNSFISSTDFERIAILPNILEYVKQTPELCLDAVKVNWQALQYVKNQTEEICEVAFKQCKHAAVFIRDPILKSKFTFDVVEESRIHQKIMKGLALKIVLSNPELDMNDLVEEFKEQLNQSEYQALFSLPYIKAYLSEAISELYPGGKEKYMPWPWVGKLKPKFSKRIK